MAHKQVSGLATLSGIAGDDLIPIFDSSEAGDEKLKKYTVQELKTNLTSMDPSAFGNWVPVQESVVSNITRNPNTNEVMDDLNNYERIKVIIDVESIASIADGYWTVDNDGTASNYKNTDGSPGGRVFLDNLTGSATIELIYTPATKLLRVNASAYSGTTPQNINLSIKYAGAEDGSQFSITFYDSGNVAWTGTYRLYVWQEVKPIELHSYELVKEYNLNNETLDDTFDWDGEANPDVKIVANMSDGRADLVFNGDNTTSAYAQRYLSATGAGTSLLYGTGTTYDKLNIGAFNRSSVSDISLVQNHVRGNVNHNGIVDGAWTLAWWKWVDSRAITSLEVNTNGVAATGNIRIYRLVKTHLFNQTIYNNTTLNVATTGSDTTGDGTTSKPFATINGAWGWLKNKTINNDITVTIQLADGTYNSAAAAIIRGIKGNIVIQGNSGNKAAVTLNMQASKAGFNVYGPGVASFQIRNMTINGNDKDEWASGIIGYYGANVYLYNVDVSNFGNAVYGIHRAHIIARGGCVFNNNQNGMIAQNMASCDADSCTISNNNNGIGAQYHGRVLAENCTFTGNSSNTWTATGGTASIY